MTISDVYRQLYMRNEKKEDRSGLTIAIHKAIILRKAENL